MNVDLMAGGQRSHPAAVQPPADALGPRHNGSSLARWIEPLHREAGYQAISAALDVWAASWSVVLALWWVHGPTEDRNVGLYSWLFVPIVVIMLATRSMYRRKLSHGFLDEVEPLETSVAVSTLTTLTIMLMLVPPLPANQPAGEYVLPSEVAVKIWVCAAVLVPAVRLMRSLTQRYLRRRFDFGASALVLGSGPIAQQLIVRMRQVPDYGLHPVGLLDDTKPTDAESFDVPYWGTCQDLESAARATGATELIVAPCAVSDEQLARTAQHAHD
ncbi:MAG: sugar transferase, partial [Actinomycetota bacterium]|nr:sugar transferase [Actinomycetota bacterium]